MSILVISSPKHPYSQALMILSVGNDQETISGIYYLELASRTYEVIISINLFSSQSLHSNPPLRARTLRLSLSLSIKMKASSKVCWLQMDDDSHIMGLLKLKYLVIFMLLPQSVRE